MEFFIGFLLGAVSTMFYVRSVIRGAIQQVIDTVEHEQQQSTSVANAVEVKVEKHDDQFFLFRADTDKFIMQGTSLQDFQNRMRTMKIQEIAIVNGKSDAAKALVEVSNQLKEQSENSRNQ